MHAIYFLNHISTAPPPSSPADKVMTPVRSNPGTATVFEATLH